MFGLQVSTGNKSRRGQALDSKTILAAQTGILRLILVYVSSWCSGVDPQSNASLLA
jgi:hypothetical protein